MSAKQRHKQRVVKRLKEKLELLSSMEENLHTVIRDHVLKTEKKCAEVLKMEDTSIFLNQYGKMEQLLDAAFNMVELLTSSAEDMIEQLEKTSSPETVTRQLSDVDIKKELEEMIHYSSGRKRHRSSEAASQTVPEEESVLNEQNVSSKDKAFCMTQSVIDTSAQQDSTRDTVCAREQKVKCLKQRSDNDRLDYKKDICDTYVNEEIEENQINEKISLTENSRKSQVKTSPKSEGRTKKEKVVPMNVRRHMNKDSILDTDGSSSGQMDSVTFNQDVVLASSPKKKNGAKKKKMSPKKKNSKMNLTSSEGNESKGSEKIDVVNNEVSVIKEKKRPSGKDDIFVKQDMRKYSNGQVLDKNMTSYEQTELSSEPSITSSQKSILEQELNELQATGSSGKSAVSDVKSTLSEKEEFPTHHKVKDNSGLSKSLPGQTSKVDNLESSVASHNVNLEETKENFDTADVRKISREPADVSVQQELNPNIGLLKSANLLTGKITPVIVSEVVSPWCFFVQKNGPELSRLMEQICIYMAQSGLSEPPLLEPEVGLICLAKYSKDGAYYRAYVMHIYSASTTIETEVSVLYVDYGNKERVKVTLLRPLPEEFKTLPMQAICCALAEVMPCNKYCMWAEEDIHVFRQYVTGQQLGCTPPICQSTGVALPLLVELIVSLPMPIIPQGGIYLSQYSIAHLMVSAKKARQVNVTEQLGLLAKSEEGVEEVAILSRNMVSSTLLAITELNESQCKPSKSADSPDNELKLEKKIETEKGHLRKAAVEMKKDRLASMKSNGRISDANLKVGEHISPRSENSDTESQRDEGQRTTGKLLEKSQKDVQGANSHLHKIKEETIELESCETVSSTASLPAVFDFPPEKGIHLSDLHFDLDDLYFNPQGQEVMLAHVKSPGEFYVHIISQQSGETLDRLMKSLNNLFENANRRKLTKLSKTFQPEVKKLCCAQFLQDNNFYRGIIQSTEPEREILKGRVLVHYIDFGDEEWLPKRRIFPLPSQFCNVPRLAIKCSLAYIKPVNDSDTVNTWPKKSVEKFIDIAGLEKTLHMHVVHGSIEDFKKGNPCADSPVLGILLVDNTGTEEVCVNMDMIREGVAQLDTDQSKHEQRYKIEKSPETRLEKWNPMEEDFFSKRNSYNIDIDDAGVATTGYKAKDEERICKFFSSGRDCWRGERCPYRHIIVESGITYDKEPVYAVSDNQQDFLPHLGNWVAMEISTILSPSHFYAILPLGNKSLDATSNQSDKNKTGPFEVSGNEETLDDLLDALNTEYSIRPAHSGNLLLRAIGEVVVARFSEDHNWYRARIIEVTDEKVKVFFLDFGNTEWLPEEEIADIKPEFLHLPFQAVECFMNIEPKSDEKWTRESKVAFRELVDSKMLVGYVKSRSWNGCLWVELYDTSTEEDINIKEELIEQGHAMKAESQESHTDYSSNLSPVSGEALLVPG